MSEKDVNVKGLFLYPNQIEAFEALPGEAVKQIVMGAFAYMNDKPVDISEPLADAFFKVICPALDYHKKQQSNGSKGGRPKTQAEPNKKSNGTKTEPNQNPDETQAEPNKKPNKKQETRNKNIEESPLRGESTRAREKSAPPPKRTYGEFGNVSLTDGEYTSLVERYGKQETDEAIKFFDLHLGAQAKKDPYKSHYLAMQKWVFTAVEEQRRKQGYSRASPTPQRPQAKPGDFDPDRQAQIMRNVLARHMAREAQEEQQ